MRESVTRYPSDRLCEVKS